MPIPSVRPAPNAPPRVAMEMTTEEVNELSRIIGYNFRTPQDLIEKVRFLTTISVDGVEIRLDPGLLTRLKSRAVRQTLGQYIQTEVKRLLHGAVGW